MELFYHLGQKSAIREPRPMLGSMGRGSVGTGVAWRQLDVVALPVKVALPPGSCSEGISVMVSTTAIGTGIHAVPTLLPS